MADARDGGEDVQVTAMRADHLPRPLRLTAFALATAVLLYLCLAPTDQLPDPGVSDKFWHTLAWFALIVLGLTLAPRRRLAIPAFALLLGVVTEGLQASMGFGRRGDWLDLAFDTVGVAAGVLTMLAWRRATKP